MTMNEARAGYASAARPIRTERGTEYAVFAQVTHRLKSVDEANRAAFPRLAEAVCDNQRLWGTLADDLMRDDNQLPAGLRAQLLSLAEFVRRHSLKVLAGRASVGSLVDINTSIMRGLRGEAEVEA
jgi:flagellar biosynthesis activator protein FlaF